MPISWLQMPWLLASPCHQYWVYRINGTLTSIGKDFNNLHHLRFFRNDRCNIKFYVSTKRLRLLTHWGRVTHICVSKLTIIGSDNGLAPERRQVNIWTNAGILLVGTLGTNVSEILSEIHTFSFKKMHMKTSSAKRRPFGLGLNVAKVLTLQNHITTRYIYKVECSPFCLSLICYQIFQKRFCWSGRVINMVDENTTKYLMSNMRNGKFYTTLLFVSTMEPSTLETLTFRFLAPDNEVKHTFLMRFFEKSARVIELPIYGIEFKPENGCLICEPRTPRDHCRRQQIGNNVTRIVQPFYQI